MRPVGGEGSQRAKEAEKTGNRQADAPRKTTAGRQGRGMNFIKEG